MAWLEDGTLLDSTLFGEPLVFSPGRRSVMRGMEQLVIGMSVGESKTERIPPELAFGNYRPELSIPVSRRWLERYDILPAVGMALDILKKNRTLVRMVVTELNHKHVTLDANHRLAGQSIVIQLDLLAISACSDAGDSDAWGNE
jgi:peptidylprolyl isomerase